MLAAARAADPESETHLADAAALPFDDAGFDCVVAFMSLQDYTEALADNGLLIERMREVAVPEAAIIREQSRRWQRLPLFLHARAVKPG